MKMNFKIKENLLIKTIQRHLNNVSKNVNNGSGLSSFILMKVFLQWGESGENSEDGSYEKVTPTHKDYPTKHGIENL